MEKIVKRANEEDMILFSKLAEHSRHRMSFNGGDNFTE